MSYTLGISTKSNKEQAELARLIHANDIPIIYCKGNAGTGKTFLSVAAALDAIIDKKKFSKLIYIREPIEVGRSLGFLPGSVEEKYSSYLAGLYDNLDEISRLTSINANSLKMNIECMPPQFIRGRSINNAILLVDECQNLKMNTIKTILTRIGRYSKVVMLGSINQIDDRSMTKEKNDFMESYEKLKDQPFVGYVELIKSERSEITDIIDKLL